MNKRVSENLRFTTRRVATAAHEIVSPDGRVIGWAVDDLWAGLMVGLLNVAWAKAAGRWPNRPAVGAIAAATVESVSLPTEETCD